MTFWNVFAILKKCGIALQQLYAIMLHNKVISMANNCETGFALMHRRRDVSARAVRLKAANLAVITLASILFFVLTVLSQAAPVRIVGEAQMELVNSLTQSARVVESASLIIIVDGPQFNINIKSVGGFNTTEDWGSDGTDLFLISDRRTPFNRDGKGVTGFAYSDRFPSGQLCSPIVQAVWLGYCSGGYFQNPTNLTGLPLSPQILPMTSPEWVTNIVKYAKDSNLPEEIKGWSRRWIKFPEDKSVEYTWYPSSGFKVWEFSGSNYVTVAQRKFPRQITLTGFVPKVRSQTNSYPGEDVIPLRRVTFVADSIEIQTQPFDPLPTSPVPDLPVIDQRFTNMTGRFMLVSHLSSYKWPTRGSLGINDTLTEAQRLSLQNQSEERKPEVSRLTAVIIIVLNLGLVILIGRVVLKKSGKSSKQNK